MAGRLRRNPAQKTPTESEGSHESEGQAIALYRLYAGIPKERYGSLQHDLLRQVSSGH